MDTQINFEDMFEFLDIRAKHFLSKKVPLNFDEIVVYPYTTKIKSDGPEVQGFMAQTYLSGDYKEDKIFFMTMQDTQTFAQMLGVTLTLDDDLND